MLPPVDRHYAEALGRSDAPGIAGSTAPVSQSGLSEVFDPEWRYESTL